MLTFDLTQRPEIEHVLEGRRAPERSDLHRKISSRLRRLNCGPRDARVLAQESKSRAFRYWWKSLPRRTPTFFPRRSSRCPSRIPFAPRAIIATYESVGIVPEASPFDPAMTFKRPPPPRVCAIAVPAAMPIWAVPSVTVFRDSNPVATGTL